MSRRRAAARRLALPALALALAGCLAAGEAAAPAEPVAARLSPDLLVVTLADGTTCRLRRSDAAESGPWGWTGPMRCPAVHTASVTLLDGPPISGGGNPAVLIEARFRPLEVEGIAAPGVEVSVSSATWPLVIFTYPHR